MEGRPKTDGEKPKKLMSMKGLGASTRHDTEETPHSETHGVAQTQFFFRYFSKWQPPALSPEERSALIKENEIKAANFLEEARRESIKPADFFSCEIPKGQEGYTLDTSRLVKKYGYKAAGFEYKPQHGFTFVKPFFTFTIIKHG